MGINSEVSAQLEAEMLEKLLTKALATRNEDVIRFSKNHILPLYLDAKATGWSSPNKELVELYESLY